MTISDYQISSVIKTYMRNMRSRVGRTDEALGDDEVEDKVLISERGMKRMLFDRIGEKMTARLRKHGQE
jgi:hypothetical protein